MLISGGQPGRGEGWGEMGTAGIDWRITQSDTNWEDIYCTFAILWDTGMCLDMTWLLNSVRFLWRPSLSPRGTQMFSLCIAVHCLQNCLLGQLKMTANANVSYRLRRFGQHSFRNKDKKWCHVFYGWSISIVSRGALDCEPFTYWSVDWQKVQEESKDRVNLTSIPISRINEYLVIPFKNEMKEYGICVFWCLGVARKALEGFKIWQKKVKEMNKDQFKKY